MADRHAAARTWIGFAVRFVCGAVIGVFVGFSWVFLLSPFESAAGNWAVFAAAVLICAILAARYGDTFWTSILRWVD
jgi:hypothetical protein